MACTYKEHPDTKIAEIIVDGDVTEEEFDAIAPKLEAFIQAHGRIKILEVIKNFTGFDWTMIPKGIAFDFEHLKDFSHCAVVTDSGWIGPFTRAAAPFFSVQIRTFSLAQQDMAWQWLVSEEG
ncbi:MAG: STAS/SEC14 domain-containing protein [Pseudomonadota bacterium]